MKKWLVVVGLAAALALPALADTTVWTIDPNHANAQFFVKHLGISTVQGEFTKVTGTITIDNSDITKSTVDVTIRGVTKPVTLKVSDLSKPIQAMGGWRRGVSATTTINRQDFGVSADPGMVGDEIHILIDLEMTHK